MDARFVDVDGARSIVGGVAVVIDVMRAYTVAAWAFHRGARSIVLVDDIDDAVAIAARPPRSLLFKDGPPDGRFDLHNSPRQLLDLDVAGRRIVQRTTAGTRAAVAAARADTLFCSGFVCATATARAVSALDPGEVTFVISGGPDADEDRACADFIAATIDSETVDPSTYLLRGKRSTTAYRLEQAVELGHPGVSEHDVAMCLDLDRFDFAMHAELTDELLVLRPSPPTA